MIVCLPVCTKDWESAVRNLLWIKELDAGSRFACLIACEAGFDLGQVETLARSYFSALQILRYPPYPRGKNPAWPRPQNWAWRHCALHISKAYREPWLWWEQDAIPIKSGWLNSLHDAYLAGGKPFLGTSGAKMHTAQQDHLNGIAIYPPDWQRWSPESMLFSDALPFDVCGGWRVMQQATLTPLIQHVWSWSNDPGGEPCSFPDRSWVAHIRRQAVLFHRCKDGSLIEHLRRKPLNDYKPPPVIPRRRMRKKGETEADYTVFHSGDLGDIIYSLLFCKSLGNVNLILGPQPGLRIRRQMNPETFHWLLPLLKRQKWIRSVEYAPDPPDNAINLNDFRGTWISPRKKSTRLFEAYFEHFVRPFPDEKKAWLTADAALDTGHPVIIARSPRYRNDRFPWQKIAETYRGRMAFIGLPEEYQDWVNKFGPAAEYRPLIDALDMANTILGARLFIGNQSFPMSLALALNVPLIQETWMLQPDCYFDRPNAQFTNKTVQVTLPALDGAQWVCNAPAQDGSYELGPCNGAAGIGDTLMLTPLARALGDRAVMKLPPTMRRLQFLFRDLCRVEISESHPVFPFQPNGLQSQGFLDMFGINGVDPVPSIEVDPELQDWAKTELESIVCPLAFCPTCSRHWAKIRQTHSDFWEPIIAELSRHFTVLQFGLQDYPAVTAAHRMKFYSLEQLAALYREIGLYVGVNTGDYHLMIAVGGKTVVAQPFPWHEQKYWSYPIPNRVFYAKLNDAKTVMEGVKKLGFYETQPRVRAGHFEREGLDQRGPVPSR